MSPLYFVAGTSITLVAFINIEGNPEPTSTWTLNWNAISSTDIRFNTMVPGQLSITNISSPDAGTYNCTLSSRDFNFEVFAIIELDPAGTHVTKTKKFFFAFTFFDLTYRPSYHA